MFRMILLVAALAFSSVAVQAQAILFGSGTDVAAFSSVVLAPAHRHRGAARAGFDRVWTADARAEGRPLELHPLLQVASRYEGRRNFTGLNAAWCAAALGRWLQEAGYSRLASYRAADYARYGRPAQPHVGAVAVLSHHVGVVAGFERGKIVLLSGNHRRRVGYGTYAFRRIIAFRDPV